MLKCRISKATHPSPASTIEAESQPSNRFDLSSTALAELAVKRDEARLARNGALVVDTGKRTGRSPSDRFIVQESSTEEHIAWGAINQPISADVFETLWNRVEVYLDKGDSFVAALHVGADPNLYLPLEVRTELAWHGMFARSIFIQPDTYNPFNKQPWRLLSAPGFTCVPDRDGTSSDGAVMIDFSGKRVLLAGMLYAGEMKKAMFTVQNYLLPDAGVLPMHCSASEGADGAVTLFFGLSGTGKTTLSSDPEYLLIGDDEHGWGEGTVFNFEGGCYAKCINLSQAHEPVIFNALSFGSILENVILNPETREPDYQDSRLTENTRACYPLQKIERRVLANRGQEPNSIIFLTCDVSGVLPPISLLSREAAAYHFLSGYTAKVGSTEIGSTEAYSATFSACFGEAFFPRRAREYANLLMTRMKSFGSQAYLVNTGWSGGGYGVGERFPIPVTRAIVKAARAGTIGTENITHLNHLNLDIPREVEGVSMNLLNPRENWQDQAAYDAAERELIAKFKSNFAKFDVSEEIVKAGPQ